MLRPMDSILIREFSSCSSTVKVRLFKAVRSHFLFLVLKNIFLLAGYLLPGLVYICSRCVYSHLTEAWKAGKKTMTLFSTG